MYPGSSGRFVGSCISRASLRKDVTVQEYYADQREESSTILPSGNISRKTDLVKRHVPEREHALIPIALFPPISQRHPADCQRHFPASISVTVCAPMAKTDNASIHRGTAGTGTRQWQCRQRVESGALSPRYPMQDRVNSYVEIDVRNLPAGTRVSPYPQSSANWRTETVGWRFSLGNPTETLSP